MIPEKCVQLLCIASILAGCAGGNQYKRSLFTFAFEGETYEIICTKTGAGDGYNVLVKREGEQVVYNARDEDQDGTLDTVRIGNITLETANKIYRAGIAQAKLKGQYSEQIPSQLYTLTDAQYNYLLETIYLNYGKVNNRLTIVDIVRQTEAKVLDNNADGALDVIETGDLSYDEYQAVYKMILEYGSKEGRIYRSNQQYLVRP